MSNVHALQDVIRHLNTRDFNRDQLGNQLLDNGPLQIGGDAVVADYATLRLSSSFQPVATAEGIQLGYKALLRSSSNATRNYHLEVSKLALSAIDRGEVVYLDRLTRTLHALNYLAKDLVGDLHVSVNPKHLLEIHGDHGAVYEKILSRCGLETNRIVLEISEYISNNEHLKIAIEGCRNRRYKIAFDNFTICPAQIARVLKYRPDIVKIDVSSFKTVADTVEWRSHIDTITENFKANGIEFFITHIEDAEDYELAKYYGFSVLQGSWLNTDIDGSQLTAVV